MSDRQTNDVGADAAAVDTAGSIAPDTASHVEAWSHHFERTYSGLCVFLASLSERQNHLSKVMPGRMIGHDIYGWDVFYPNWRHRPNPFVKAFVASGDLPPEIATGNQATSPEIGSVPSEAK